MGQIGMGRWAALALPLVLSIGCTNATDERDVELLELSQATDEQKAMKVLESAGIGSDRITPFQDGYLVDGDIFVEQSDLVARANDMVEKGYWCGWNEFEQVNTNTSCFYDPIQMNYSTGIGLVYETSNLGLPLDWPFAKAAKYWSQAHNLSGVGSDVYIDGGATHKQGSYVNIEVSYEDLGSSGPIGYGTWPRWTTWGVAPGSKIVINQNAAYTFIWASTVKLTNVAMHELGHTLGFAHPEASSLTNIEHISGTSSGTDYDTVMSASYSDDTVARLQYDDARSLVKKSSTISNMSATPDTAFCDPSTSFAMRNGCDVGEGDCDSINTSAECKFDLRCTADIGAKYELPANYDVCTKAASCTAYDEAADADYCNNIDCPCGVLEADCDAHTDCGGRLRCGWDRGAAIGRPSSWDVCILPEISGCPDFDSASWDWSFCTAGCPCNLMEGDCDTDADCRGSLVCGQNVGDELGFGSAAASWDLCVSPEFFGDPV